jgi:hypothetical protein
MEVLALRLVADRDRPDDRGAVCNRDEQRFANLGA